MRTTVSLSFKYCLRLQSFLDGDLAKYLIQVLMIKYLKYFLYAFSLISISLAVSINIYYSHNRNLHSADIPDSMMNHDTNSQFYSFADTFLSLFIISIIPALLSILILLINIHKIDKNSMIAAVLYVCSILLLGMTTGKAFTYYFD